MLKRTLLLLASTLLLACPGELENPPAGTGKLDLGGNPPKKDTGGQPPKKDTGGQPPKDQNWQPPKKDTGGWPPPLDQYVPPKQDQGGYKPSPFGCQVDAECFGLRCCATPWGVKLCAEECTW